MILKQEGKIKINERIITSLRILLIMLLNNIFSVEISVSKNTKYKTQNNGIGDCKYNKYASANGVEDIVGSGSHYS